MGVLERRFDALAGTISRFGDAPAQAGSGSGAGRSEVG
jgi:hypothetical protein